MILYFIPAEHRYVHRQTDVPKGFDFKKVDVPTSQADLMEFLNQLWAAHVVDLSLAKAAGVVGVELPNVPDDLEHGEDCGRTESMPNATLADQIIEIEDEKFPIVLVAALERLGLARKDGWNGLPALLKNNPAAERGIGALFAAREF